MRKLAKFKAREVLPAPGQACNTQNRLFFHSTTRPEVRDQTFVQRLELSRVLPGQLRSLGVGAVF